MFLQSQKALELNEVIFFHTMSVSPCVLELRMVLAILLPLEDVLDFPRYTTHLCTLHH